MLGSGPKEEAEAVSIELGTWATSRLYLHKLAMTSSRRGSLQPASLGF